MADSKAVVHPVESCNLGIFGADGIALRINFTTSEAERQSGLHQHVVFGLSRELAQGLMSGLATILERGPAAPKH